MGEIVAEALPRLAAAVARSALRACSIQMDDGRGSSKLFMPSPSFAARPLVELVPTELQQRAVDGRSTQRAPTADDDGRPASRRRRDPAYIVTFVGYI